MVSMNKLSKIDLESKDQAAENLSVIAQHFPEAIENGAVNFDLLRRTLEPVLVEGSDDHYELSWSQKQEARQAARKTTSATLLPQEGRSKSWESARNLVVQGDSLEVLKVLQKSFYQGVDVIYIAPPYNTGADDVLASDVDAMAAYEASLEALEKGASPAQANTKSSSRYHSNWLSMMYPRLVAAKSLLSKSGVIFVSIDDHESHNLRLIMDEVFGPDHFICSFAWQKRYSPPPDVKEVGYVHESILMYRRSDSFKAHRLPATEEQLARYKNPDDDPRGPWKSADYTCRYTSDERPTLYYPIHNPNTGEVVWPKKSRVWNTSRENTIKNQEEGRLWWGIDGKNSTPALKNFLSDVNPGRTPDTLLKHEDVGHTDEAAKEIRRLLPGVKANAKPTRLIEHLLRIGGNSQAVVLDFFAGLGSTGHSVLKLNSEDGGSRRFILVERPEPIEGGEFASSFEALCQRLDAASQELSSDDGYKVFHLARSNFKPWDSDYDGLKESLFANVDSLREDRSDEDVFY